MLLSATDVHKRQHVHEYSIYKGAGGGGGGISFHVEGPHTKKVVAHCTLLIGSSMKTEGLNSNLLNHCS